MSKEPQTTTEEIIAALRGSYPPGPPRHILLKAADEIERLSKEKDELEDRLDGAWAAAMGEDL